MKSLVVSVEYHSAFYYDYDDRMTFVEFGGSSTNRVQYTYDGLGRLIQYRPRNGGTSRDTDYTYLPSPVPIPGMSTAHPPLAHPRHIGALFPRPPYGPVFF